MKTRIASLKVLAVAVAIGAVVLVTNAAANRDTTQASVDPVARGKYLVESIGCADCHTPLVMGPKGPERDRARHLSGHPQDLALPAAQASAPWPIAASGTLTAWSGPWGTSFTANLTPDADTGLGKWTPEQFIEAIRSRRHLGRGRPLLPPMPAEFYANLDDQDLRAIFAYLRSIPSISNRVPEPLPPGDWGRARAAASRAAVGR
jgi:Cytochrome c